MEVVQVLHMNGGMGDSSYAQNSLVQQKVISLTQPILEEAITSLYRSSFPTSLAIADLGCSSGPNTLLVVSELVKTVDIIRRKFGHESPEYQVLLNDLPGNDFNSIFRTLPKFQEEMKLKLGDGFVGHCAFHGVPGSFYGRLFRRSSLDFVHSSYSLMWLSKVPDGLEGNNGNIYMASTSPPEVLRSYYEQFRSDFGLFLKCRSVELVEGGRMVVTFLGRRSENPASKECCYIWELMALALNQMVLEGLIEEDKFNSFNIPQYTPSPSEVKQEIEKEGSFEINRLEVSEVNWDVYEKKVNVTDDDDDDDDVCKDKVGGYNVAKCMRAVAEPSLVSHFGEEIIDGVFVRYREIVADRMAKERTQFVNVTVSATKLA